MPLTALGAWEPAVTKVEICAFMALTLYFTGKVKLINN